MKKVLRLGTRGSSLALVQTNDVSDRLTNAFPDISIDIIIIKTEGDTDRTSPLSEFGGRGAFVRSIETSLLNGEIDSAIHSLKDLPSNLPDGLVLAAAPVREDARDVIITRNGEGFDELPAGSTVGTGSERRSAQIMALRPDIICRGIRGNVETRLKKLDSGEFEAIILAAAGIRRLDLASRIAGYFEPDTVLPAPCQGIIGIECRAEDKETLKTVSVIDNPDIHLCADAERAFINTLGLGCHAPVGALATIDGDSVSLRVYVKPDTKSAPIRESVAASKETIVPEAAELGRSLKERLKID